MKPSYLLFYLTLVADAALLIDYTGGQPASVMGGAQLEGQHLGDKIPLPGNSSIFIKPGNDSNGRPALHYHRDPHFRRTEVHGKGSYAANHTYFVGYNFRLPHILDPL